MVAASTKKHRSEKLVMSEIKSSDHDGCLAGAADERQLASIGWAVMHEPTREAYRRCTGEDAGPVLVRYRAWLAENILGGNE